MGGGITTWRGRRRSNATICTLKNGSSQSFLTSFSNTEILTYLQYYGDHAGNLLNLIFPNTKEGWSPTAMLVLLYCVEGGGVARSPPSPSMTTSITSSCRSCSSGRDGTLYR